MLLTAAKTDWALVTYSYSGYFLFFIFCSPHPYHHYHRHHTHHHPPLQAYFSKRTRPLSIVFKSLDSIYRDSHLFFFFPVDSPNQSRRKPSEPEIPPAADSGIRKKFSLCHGFYPDLESAGGRGSFFLKQKQLLRYIGQIP